MGQQLLMEKLYAQAEARPEQLALVYAEQRISYGELVERIERLAAGLAERGVAAGDSVGLVLRDDPWMVTCFHAVTALGASVVPVNPAFKQEELEFCFRSAGVGTMIADERSAGVCERIAAGFDRPVEVITSSSGHGQSVTLESLAEGATPQRLAPREPDEVYVYQFSSGSTGRPKRVPRTQAQCAAEAELWADLDLTPDDKVFCAIPLFHTYGMGACLFATAQSGATLVMLEEPNPFLLKRHRALELLERERITVFPGVPLNFRLLADAPAEADLSAIRLCTSAGTALPRETFEHFGERFGVLVRQLYGTTETGIMSMNLSDDPIGSFESVGTPLGDVRFEILDEDGASLAVGETGEIAVASPAMTSGYADLPEVNREAFRDGRFMTGDLGSLDGDGMLRIEGRKKLLIEVGGYKVDPIEVEDVIAGHDKVEEVVVVGVPGAKPGEETVKAVLVLGEECERRELVEYCRERLANYKVPRELEFRDEIPKSPLGKVLRKYLV
ncbi:MAG TPA: AMP-binding protein [Thermoleophilaceae bacterium]|nr:AMP-binding protein [Thermoleophilaceae bacterium]